MPLLQSMGHQLLAAYVAPTVLAHHMYWSLLAFAIVGLGYLGGEHASTDLHSLCLPARRDCFCDGHTRPSLAPSRRPHPLRCRDVGLLALLPHHTHSFQKNPPLSRACFASLPLVLTMLAALRASITHQRKRYLAMQTIATVCIATARSQRLPSILYPPRSPYATPLGDARGSAPGNALVAREWPGMALPSLLIGAPVEPFVWTGTALCDARALRWIDVACASAAYVVGATGLRVGEAMSLMVGD